MSLAQLTAWCDERFGRHAPAVDPADRACMTSHGWRWTTLGQRTDFGWRIEMALPTILEGIARHADEHPEWLEVSRA